MFPQFSDNYKLVTDEEIKLTILQVSKFSSKHIVTNLIDFYKKNSVTSKGPSFVKR